MLLWLLPLLTPAPPDSLYRPATWGLQLTLSRPELFSPDTLPVSRTHPRAFAGSQAGWGIGIGFQHNIQLSRTDKLVSLVFHGDLLWLDRRAFFRFADYRASDTLPVSETRHYRTLAARLGYDVRLNLLKRPRLFLTIGPYVTLQLLHFNRQLLNGHYVGRPYGSNDDRGVQWSVGTGFTIGGHPLDISLIRRHGRDNIEPAFNLRENSWNCAFSYCWQ